jgi:hypothetical protein
MNEPKEKAKELIGIFLEVGLYIDTAKQCALIAVDEILDVCKTYLSSYYLEVKKEIEKL